MVLHGWQDNSGSFDTLIPLLPRHVSYLAIDLPGHGLSSHLPNGMLYSTLVYIYVLRMIHKKFNWEKISLCAHSMGAIISFFYASSFINECDMVVALDALVPIEANNYFLLDSYQFGFEEIYIADQRNIAGTEPPSYSYEMVEEKLMNGVFSSYTKETLPYLLRRGMKESKSNPNKYFFTRDNRLKARSTFIVQEKELNVEMASRITAPYCYIKALLYPFNAQGAYMDDILQTMKSCNPKFEVHGVDGDHHVHLTEPLKVSHIVSKFINLHRPINIFHKL